MGNEMYRIVGAKIRKLREETGLTQEDLARSVGLSSEFISLLELGKRSPSLESLSRIARFLNKDISFFIVQKEEPFKELTGGEGGDKKTQRLMKKFRRYCSDYLELEELTGRQPNLAPVYTNVSAIHMAEQERHRLDLGSAPISNIFSLLELNGLHIWRSPLSEELKISGVFVFLEHKQAAFALVNSSQPVGFQILTAAHEYGHYLKDRYDGPVVDNPDIFIEDYITLYPGREKFAQTFALNFLVPPKTLEEIIEKDIRRKRLHLEDILYLRRYFGVSFLTVMQILKRREYLSLSRFKEWQKLDTDTFEQTLFNRRKKPVHPSKKGRFIPSERFVCLVIDALRMGKIPAKKAARLLHIKMDELLLLINR
jgi:transcriptional regulator with XRE-family HTH domain